MNSTAVPATAAKTGSFLKVITQTALVVFAALLLVPAAQAQNTNYIRFKSGMSRATVPVNASSTVVLTNQVRFSGLDVNGVSSLTVTGLPSGATALVSPTSTTANNTALTITINTTASLAEGVYNLSLNGSGNDTNSVAVSDSYSIVLQAGFLWNGGTNAAVNGSGNYSDSTKWLGGGVPGAGDDAIFSDLGSQSNSTLNGVLSPNIIVTASITNASARFSSTNATFNTYCIQLNPAVTWTLTGSNGFTLLRDYIDGLQGFGSGTPLTEVIYGTNASLVVSNEHANFAMLVDNGSAETLDLSSLDNFSADVSRFNLGDFVDYPNYANIDFNSYAPGGTPSGLPKTFFPTLRFAKTNVIKAIYADPNNYTNSDTRDWSFSDMKSQQSGSSTVETSFLGISNIFFVDSFNITGAGARSQFQFNANLHFTTNIVPNVSTNIVTNNMTCTFRGTNGGRMSVFSISDGAGTNSTGTNLKSTDNFANTGGSIDMLVDRFYIGRDRAVVVTNGPNFQGQFIMGNGIVDANTAILGFREHSMHPPVGTWAGYCEGTVTVQSNGTFKVNKTLTLGSTTETNIGGLGSGGNTEYGQVTVLNGATLMASNIVVGGPVFGASTNNFIFASNNCSVIVSNSIGSTNQGLNTLTFDANSSLTLFVDGNNTNPYVYTMTLSTLGSNTIVIGGIKHLSAITAPVQLVQFTAGGGSFQGLVMPPGVGGALLTTNNSGIWLQVLPGNPKNIVWRGYNSQDWDFTTANWLDLVTGLHTNFANGDSVNFDDTAVPTTIHLGGATDLIPGSVGMTNNSNYFIIDGTSGGDIQGSAAVTKSGTNGLEIDGPTTLAVHVNLGYLVGSGTVGSANIAAGASMNYTGSALNGVACSGTAILNDSTPNSSGSLVVSSTGMMTNAGIFNGTFSMSSGGYLENDGQIGPSGKYASVGSPVVAAGATLYNNGDIHALTLTINGTLRDSGNGTIYMYGNVPTGAQGLTIGSGGVFLPGEGVSLIGTTKVNAESGSPVDFPGRVLLSAGSTNVFVVNTGGSPVNTMLDPVYLGWGPNQSAGSINGSTIVISNVGPALTAGTTLTLAQDVLGGNPFNCGLNTTNSFPIIVPATPGPGLAWDQSQIYVNGSLSVRTVNTTPPTMAIATSFNTNGGPITTLSWPADRTGFRLQTQTDSLHTGIGTNWSDVFGSTFANSVVITNNPGTNCVFFRLVYP